MHERPTVCFKMLRAAAVVPAYQSEYAAGMDLCACPSDGRSIKISVGEISLIPCGFSLAIPPGFEGQVRPRSGLATKHGITLPNSPGTIDADYRGEVMVPLINHGRAAYVVEPGMRVAQLVIAPVARVIVEVVDELPPTVRGSGGFGSTGI